MSRLLFEDGDPGNLPAVIDPVTRKVLPPESPLSKAAAVAFLNQTTLEERRAWHAVTCLNSRKPEDLELFAAVARKIEAAMSGLN